MRKFVLLKNLFDKSLKMGYPGNLDNNSECNNIANYFRFRSVQRESTDLRKLLKSKIDQNSIFFSFEVSPVKDNNFYENFFREMNKYHPLFYALTCHSKNNSSLEMLNNFPSNTLLHVILSNLTRVNARIILKKALDYGLTNIFVLRGDSTNVGDFPHAVDLVRFVRNEFGYVFCICVAGYPEMHPESASKEMDLFYLKEKVDAGADFIITQIFFEADIFIKFVNDCKNFGINVPIVPGIFPFHNYECLGKMSKICKIKIPQHILDVLQPIKNSDDEICKYGVNLTTNIVKDIIVSGTTCGFHLFTLNRTTMASKICNELSLN